MSVSHNSVCRLFPAKPSVWPTHPFSNVRKQTSKQPLQLRRIASRVDKTMPRTAESERPFSDGSVTICQVRTRFAFHFQDRSHALLTLDSRAFCLAVSTPSAWVSAYILRNSSTAAKLSETRCRVLKSATTSDRCSKSGLTFGLSSAHVRQASARHSL